MTSASRANKNTVKGMWSAWAAILSAPLRYLVLEHVPDPLWDRRSSRSCGDAR
jgi:hypothetical protein